MCNAGLRSILLLDLSGLGPINRMIIHYAPLTYISVIECASSILDLSKRTFLRMSTIYIGHIKALYLYLLNCTKSYPRFENIYNFLILKQGVVSSPLLA